MKFILTFILIIFTSFECFAKAYLTYQDYLVLPPNNKIEVIELIQDHAKTTELLQRYNEIKHRPKTSHINNFLNYFKAYANDQSSPERFTCMFGGWLSIYYENPRAQSRGAICANPKRLSYEKGIETNEVVFNSWMNNKTKFNEESKNLAIKSGEYYDSLQKELKTTDKEFTKVVIKENDGKFNVELHTYKVGQEDSDPKKSCNANSRNGKDVICNPMIYGRYKDSPICVPNPSNDAYNTSLLCSKALEVIKEKDENEYQRTMKVAVEESINKPDLFSHSLANMYSTCMCKGEGYDFVDPNYAKKIYNTRTCLAIMNQTKSLIESISENGACFSHKSDLAGTNDLANFFKKTYKLVNDELDELNQSLSLDALNTYYKNNAQRNIEENKINQIRDKFYAQRNTSKNNCPIDLGIINEDSKIELTATGDSEINKNTDHIKLSLLKNSQQIHIKSINFKIIKGEVESKDQSEIKINENGNASMIAKRNLTESYQIEFEAKDNEGNIAIANYTVNPFNPDCIESEDDDNDGVCTINNTLELSYENLESEDSNPLNISFDLTLKDNNVLVNLNTAQLETQGNEGIENYEITEIESIKKVTLTKSFKDDYNLEYTANHNNQEASTEVSIPKAQLTCEINSELTDQNQIKSTISVEIDGKIAPPSLTKDLNISVNYENESLTEQAIGENSELIYISSPMKSQEETEEDNSTNEKDLDKIIATVTPTDSDPVTCTSGASIVEIDQDEEKEKEKEEVEKNLAQSCEIKIINQAAGNNQNLALSGTIKLADGQDIQLPNLSEGLKLSWHKVDQGLRTPAKQESTSTDGMVNDGDGDEQDESDKLALESFSSEANVSLPSGQEAYQIFAVISQNGKELCRDQMNIEPIQEKVWDQGNFANPFPNQQSAPSIPGRIKNFFRGFRGMK